MQKDNQLYPLITFFLMALGITVGIIIPLIIVGLYYLTIRDWWHANSFNGLYILMPSALILFRWLYKTIEEKRFKV